MNENENLTNQSSDMEESNENEFNTEETANEENQEEEQGEEPLEDDLISRRGKSDYLKFKNGQPLSHKEAILAQCYMCYIEGADAGELDCITTDCPLYAFQPYNSNPNKKKRTMSEENRKQAAERMRKMHEQKNLAKIL
jgi:hypothetical protein